MNSSQMNNRNYQQQADIKYARNIAGMNVSKKEQWKNSQPYNSKLVHKCSNKRKRENETNRCSQSPSKTHDESLLNAPYPKKPRHW